MSGQTEVIGLVKNLSEGKTWVNLPSFKNYKIHTSTTNMNILNTGGGEENRFCALFRIKKSACQTGFVSF